MRRIIWLYGKPGSGKTTLGHFVRAALTRLGQKVALLDSDHLRLGPNLDLGFDGTDRNENVHRLALFALLLSERNAGPWVIVSAVTPKAAYRMAVRGICDPLLVYLDRPGRKLWFGTRFEENEQSALHLFTETMPPEDCTQAIIATLRKELLL